MKLHTFHIPVLGLLFEKQAQNRNMEMAEGNQW